MAGTLRLEALAQFLSFLSTMPNIDKVARALVRGPLSVFGARAAIIVVVNLHTDMTIVSHFGHTAAELSRYRKFAIEIDLPANRAYREVAMNYFPVDDVPDAFPAVALDRDKWDRMSERLSATAVVSAPITCDGAAIGAFSFHIGKGLAWQEVDKAYLEVLGAALGLWLSHPQNGLQDSLGLQYVEQDAPLHLSRRQVQILTLVQRGLSNDRIAAHLGFSLSTIKNEMQVIYKVLRTSDRKEAVERATSLCLMPEVAQDGD